MRAEEPFSQLQLRFSDPIQGDYEIIRPIILYSTTVSERSRETDHPRSTIGDKAKRFVQEGMLGLIDKRTQSAGRQTGFPDVVANYILHLKHLYPPIHYREIVRIVEKKFGYKTDHKKVMRFLKKHPISVQLELGLKSFHQFDEAYDARWTVIRLFYEGWNKKSIAGFLKLSHTHVATLIEVFEKDGFTALEDKRTRPASHAHNQMTLPFLEQVYQTQVKHPDAGSFRVLGILEKELGEKTPSERTIGRAMQHNRFWRGAHNPYAVEKIEPKEPAELPYKPLYRHHYWFIDIRYLVKLDGKWIYSICIIEGFSRAILAGMSSRHQDEIAILQLLHAAFGDYGLPWGIVSDNGSVFTAEAFNSILEKLEIKPCLIEKRQAWQNLIETQFNVQRRLADAQFNEATEFEQIQDQHATFVQIFNTTRHWAHRNRSDGCVTPISVLGGELGRSVTPDQLQRVFKQLQFSRVVNRHGCVSIQRFCIYAERGLAKKRVAIWLYQDRLHVEYQQTLLARYQYRFNRKTKKIAKIDKPKLFHTMFASPQIELFELNDQEWLKILERPQYARRSTNKKDHAKQLLMAFLSFICLT